jgi:metal-sulfur cluster biosynthetic enzyme
MPDNITREDVLNAIEKVEHPEIAATLTELGMILDVAVNGNVANVAMALPMMGIPEAVRNALVFSIQKPVEELGLQMQVQFFEMTPEVRDNFFAISQARWKGSI